MNTAFIYSTSRVNTLSQYLLTKTDIDRLLVSGSGLELQAALKETYLAPFILDAADESVAEAIEQTLIQAKKLIHRIAPQGDHFRVLWVQYDIHNLRVFAKATAGERSFDELTPFLSRRGIYPPTELRSYLEQGLLNRLQSGWQEAYNEALRHVEAGELDQVDGIFDTLYFTTVRRIATTGRDAYLQTHVRTSIDLFNLKARLRSLRYPEVKFTPTFISGGTFAEKEIESKEQVEKAFTTLAGANTFSTAIATYEATGNTTELDVRADEHLVNVAKQASFDMFSSASLVLYYLLCRQAAANVRTIVVGKNNGQSEPEIRANLRLAYVND